MKNPPKSQGCVKSAILLLTDICSYHNHSKLNESPYGESRTSLILYCLFKMLPSKVPLPHKKKNVHEVDKSYLQEEMPHCPTINV